MNLPTIEELDKTGCEAAGYAAGYTTVTVNNTTHCRYLTAIRDAVVAACKPQPVDPANIPDLVTHLDPRNCGLTIQLGVKAAAEINDKFRERMVEALAACRPQLRPIAEMPKEVPEGCVRVFRSEHGGWYDYACAVAVLYIDIALPEPTYPADFEAAFAESGMDASNKAAAFKLWKGGAR